SGWHRPTLGTAHTTDIYYTTTASSVINERGSLPTNQSTTAPANHGTSSTPLHAYKRPLFSTKVG
ncbi:hypothetical protein C0992_011034, partial [Termitomyces sp. T32_za158]